MNDAFRTAGDAVPIDRDALRAAQVRMLFRLWPSGLLAGTLVALALSGYLWFVHALVAGAAFGGYFAFLALAHAAVWLAYRRAPDVTARPGAWQLGLAAAMLASGLGWGAAAYLFFPLEPLLTGTVVAAVGVAGLLALAPSPVVLAAFAVPTFLPLGYRLIGADGAGPLATAGLLAVLVLTLLLQGDQLRRAIREALGTRLEKDRLAGALGSTRAALEAANAQLGTETREKGSIEEELKGAQIAAEAANMAKDEFLATMSHEIRTPLNGILPLLDILRSTPLDETQRDYLDTAFTSSKHLLTIIDDILDYSKIEAGKLSLEIVGINLRELLDSVVRLMASSARRKGLSLETRIDPDVRLAMRGDPVRLRQVLTNLVSNAVKFTDDGSVTITVSKREEFPRETELLFAVRDTGVGMDRKAAERLFKPFSQADASTTRTHGGTGLGLAICKRLVELMHGRIGVRSEPGRGSVFWFTVRLKKSHGDIQKSTRDVAGARCLLVTGDRAFSARFEVFSEGWGAQLVKARSLADAANRLRGAAELGAAWRFDIVVLDHALGDDTLALAEEIRRNPSLSEQGILLLTQDGDSPERLTALERAGARARDASEATLRESIQRLLDGEEGAPHAAIDDRELAYEQTGDAAGALAGTVLLVEDNPVNLHVAQKLLEAVGVDFVAAKNGEAALRELEAAPERFRAVIMDCMMPVMDGYLATRRWRAYEAEHGLPRLPIIAMTANAMAGDREKCLEAGMDDYMAKPMNLEVLRRTLGQWISGAEEPRRPSPALGSTGAGERAAARVAAAAARRPAAAPADGREPASTAAAGEAAAPAPAMAPARAGSPSLPAAGAQARPSSPTGEVIDRDALEDLRAIMGDDFRDLVDVYLEDSPNLFRALVRAAEAQAVGDMVRPAHSLKSTSANLGAMPLADLARAVEHDARRGSVPQARRRIAQMLKVYKAGAVELKKLRDA